jgi:hypothetical protein
VHALIKFAQIRDVFVCDLMAAIKVCQGDLCNMYLEQSSNFMTNTFWVFKSLLECKHGNIHMKWILDFNFGLQRLAFKVHGQHIWVVHCDLETMTPIFVIEFIFVVVKSLVKNQCKGKFLKLSLLACLIFFFNLLIFVLSSHFCRGCRKHGYKFGCLG